MSVTDDDRRHLHEMVRRQLGERAANTVMELLPHAGWSDLVRQADLEATEHRILAEMYKGFGEMDRRFGEIDRRFGEIDRRFGEIAGRFGTVDRRFGEIERRISMLIATNVAVVVSVLVSATAL